MKIETQIDEAQARIEALRLELALVESHKSRLQLAQNLVREITDTIGDKLEELAALVSPDCLEQAVSAITLEVEKAATSLLPNYEESEIENLEAEENQEIKQYQPQYFDEEKSDEPDACYIGEEDDSEEEELEPPSPDELSLSLLNPAVAKQYQAQYFEEVELDGKVFKIGDRVKINESSAKYAGITGTIIKLEKTFATIIPDDPYFLKVGKREIPCPDFYWYISEMELLEEPNAKNQPIFKVGDRVKISEASEKMAAGKTGEVIKIGEGNDIGSAMIRLDQTTTNIWWELNELELLERELEPEQINNILDSQSSNNFAPLEQYNDCISYRNVPGQTGTIVYLGSGNKGRLESWLHWLIVRHNFADCGEVVSPQSDKERRTRIGKHHLKLWHLDPYALGWICQNYDPKSNPPHQDVSDRKRPDPAAPQPYVPTWHVRVDAVEIFTGTEVEARQLYTQKMQEIAAALEAGNAPPYWTASLQDETYKPIETWFKQEAVPKSFLTYKEDFDAGLTLLQGDETEERLEELAEASEGMEELENYATNMQALHTFGGLVSAKQSQPSEEEKVEATPF